ncbi:hypothetical protein K438DRAFT_1989183 [Mycena galopus ATCC 62051]|nr:hypothetical protein K438DRAFT_1989183 [Mycena galopus ATCC 62051]
MHYKLAIALVLACFAITLSAAPVAEVAVAREPVEEPRVACTLQQPFDCNLRHHGTA